MENRYIPEIIRYDVNWSLIKSATMQTIGKDVGKEPTDEWKEKLLIARHSPIRRSMISVKWEQIPSFVSTHIARHHLGCEKFIQTSRSDRTNIDRNERKQTDFVSMQLDMNLQALINICEARLCMQADAETRNYINGLVLAIKEQDAIVAKMLAPAGIYNAGCKEVFGNCSYCTNFLNTLSKEQLLNLRERLNAYNEYQEKSLSRKRTIEDK